MKKLLFFALAIGLLAGATASQAQIVNMSRHITLTVAKDSAIKLNFVAAAPNTPVKVKSGSLDTTFTINNGWTNATTYTAADTTMTIYGDITSFDCSENYGNLTALDVSHNTQLTELYCYRNNLSSLDPSQNTQLTTLGCFSNQLSSLNITNNTQLTKLKCFSNQLSSLNILQNTQLTYLDCGTNQLSVLDISQNTQLMYLDCSPNQLSSLDVSKNTQLYHLWCYDNQLTTLDVSHNTLLEKLSCSDNQLTTLDVSKNTQLTGLFCNNNNLSSLDVSECPQLRWLKCYNNDFSTAALNDIYCALPIRQVADNARIFPIYNSSSSDTAIVAATNAQNAISKNWKVQYFQNDTDITTTGTKDCNSVDIAEASAEQALTLYPNPVADVLYLSATARTVRVYNIYGTEVAHATDTDRVEVSHLPAGIYTVKADGTVAKMVKR